MLRTDPHRNPVRFLHFIKVLTNHKRTLTRYIWYQWCSKMTGVMFYDKEYSCLSKTTATCRRVTKLSSSGGLEGSKALSRPDCVRFLVSVWWNLTQSAFLKLHPGVVWHLLSSTSIQVWMDRWCAAGRRSSGEASQDWIRWVRSESQKKRSRVVHVWWESDWKVGVPVGSWSSMWCWASSCIKRLVSLHLHHRAWFGPDNRGLCLLKSKAQIVEESCLVGCAESQDCRCWRVMSVSVLDPGQDFGVKV